ncbi:iron complex outermembrane receptor protein [Azospirillum agricola]|uniref:TonB-dependent receptor family protein n=1 Tax=Azospirillum agricola TaxID=1720247 RepID=UPI001AE822D1|nr:TonB-dependent receptor [Azospirillum agricola]MBP2232616.1 iron complex outermembrane receptor protein [Azospirillum agricola]
MSSLPLRTMPRPALMVALMASAAPLAFAQDAISPTQLPPVTVTGTSTPSLTVPTTDEAEQRIQRTPGGVELVPDTAFKNGTANTIRDVLGWVPGVVTQPKSNIDNRVSIRGSGLTRNYGNRGVNLYMDGIPINTSDGLFDVFEIDPGAYRYVEVYKGANALRYGANALGGAVNFVTPTGHDASRFDGRLDTGSFGFLKGQASTGGTSGAFDYFANVSAQREDGYRDHSDGHMERGSVNLGYRFSPDAETRFYLNANSWRQRLPGELTKSAALNAPTSADSEFVRQDQQRNIDSIRLANKTTLRFDDTDVEFGVFNHRRHVDHPIYRYLDYTVNDYGGFVSATDDRTLAGFRNRLVVGANVLNGTMDYEEFNNPGGAVKGALVFSTRDKAENYSAYAENSFFVVPEVAVIAGVQFLHAVRDRTDRFLSDGDQSGRRTYDLWSPKVGVLWDVDPNWQLFANVSRSAEVPTFDSNSFATPASSAVNAQTATTYEIGTRGRRPDVTWDLALYRSNIRNELQCVATSPYSTCSVRNADKTVHQGVELGLGVAVLKALAAQDDRTWLNLTYTYSDFFFDGATYHGNSLPGVPPHSVRAELLYKHPSGFYAGPSVDWMPKAFHADNANTLKADPYSLLNLKIGFDQGSGVSGYLEGRNLLDKRYISSTITAETATAASALFNPGYGRAVHAGMRFTW